jgi:hypothetical protein
LRIAEIKLTIKVMQPRATALPPIMNTSGRILARFFSNGSTNGRKHRQNVIVVLIPPTHLLHLAV